MSQSYKSGKIMETIFSKFPKWDDCLHGTRPISNNSHTDFIQTLQINLQAIEYVEQKHLVLLQAQRKKKRNKIHPASHQNHSIRNTLFITGFL